MNGPANPALDDERRRLFDHFARTGAQVVDPPMLQPAGMLLDLYGEDIRARAFATRDPLAGELVLRPDFTVPVVQMHMASGAETARYTYVGKVFRTQEAGTGRPSEYDQVGFEIFDGRDPAAADAEVFALLADALSTLPVRAATGDIGVLMAAVSGLSASERRKAALIRHIWRPERFRALLAQYCGKFAASEAKAALLAAHGTGSDVLAGAGPVIGRRSEAEIRARIEALAEDAAAGPIEPDEANVVDALIGLRAKSPEALERLAGLAKRLPAIRPAVEQLERRLAALARCGVDVGALDFEGSYGRTTMEYYDGFVFGFYAEDRPGLPPVATGGRYDALTRELGGDGAVPAVGGVIRPALTLELGGAAQ